MVAIGNCCLATKSHTV